MSLGFAFIFPKENCRHCQNTKQTRLHAQSENDRQGILKMVSEFPQAGIIALGLTLSTILLQLFLEDRPDDFVDALPDWSTTEQAQNPRGLKSLNSTD